MKQGEYNIIGVMSGTSLDGLDLVYVKMKFEGQFSFEIKKAETISYTDVWRNKLENGFHLTGEELTKLDAAYGIFLGNTLHQFIKDNNINEVDFIASHGHTIYHNPKESYTLQIGNGPYITSITGIRTICNFRVQDIALGGQGAPLVPIGDELLFAQYNYCLNLGGFANISENVAGQRLAFDICPVNIVMNHYVKSLGLAYDDRGQLASTGVVHQELMESLNRISFFNEKPPKSLGYEFVVKKVFPVIDNYPLEVKDILRTFIEHITHQIVHVLESNPHKTCLVTGGGAYNDFLLERVQSLTKIRLIIASDEIINYKEALIFALLGYLKNEGAVNCLSGVTGASKDHSSGIIFNPDH